MADPSKLSFTTHASYKEDSDDISLVKEKTNNKDVEIVCCQKMNLSCCLTHSFMVSRTGREALRSQVKLDLLGEQCHSGISQTFT